MVEIVFFSEGYIGQKNESWAKKLCFVFNLGSYNLILIFIYFPLDYFRLLRL